MTKPVFRLDERTYPDGQLIPTNTAYWRRIEFRKAVFGRPSLFYRSAIESIDAAMPLLVIGHVSQAYSLFFQSLEVCLKGLLDELKSEGLAGWMAKNPELAKQLAANSTSEVLTDIAGMSFIPAFRGTDPIVGFSEDLRSRHTEIYRVRNDIVHRGGDSERNPYYLGLILSCLLPMLDEFFRKVLRLDLADLILHPISRELVVAAKYRRIVDDDTRTFANCISHLYTAYFSIWRLGDSGIPEFDPSGESNVNVFADEFIKWQEHFSRQLKFDKVGDDDTSTYCRICGETCFVTSGWNDDISENGLSFDVQEVACPFCRLEIHDPLLAEIHYGRVNRDLFDSEDEWNKLLRDIDYDNKN